MRSLDTDVMAVMAIGPSLARRPLVAGLSHQGQAVVGELGDGKRTAAQHIVHEKGGTDILGVQLAAADVVIAVPGVAGKIKSVSIEALI